MLSFGPGGVDVWLATGQVPTVFAVALRDNPGVVCAGVACIASVGAGISGVSLGLFSLILLLLLKLSSACVIFYDGNFERLLRGFCKEY